MPKMKVLKDDSVSVDGKDLSSGDVFDAPAPMVPSLVERGIAEKAEKADAPRLRPKPKEKEADDA